MYKKHQVLTTCSLTQAVALLFQLTMYQVTSCLLFGFTCYHHKGVYCNGYCCCIAADTASEHRMFERLMVEDLVHWARDYKVITAAACHTAVTHLVRNA
jgi:hypothetical protein